MKQALISALCLCICAFLRAEAHSPREIYLDLMQQAVEAYDETRLLSYVESVEREGVTEHGFPRLAANMGILIAHGRMPEYRDVFVRMMDICVRELPEASKRPGHGGAEFSVKELVCCILELEQAGIFAAGQTQAWRVAMSGLVARDTYHVQPEPGYTGRGYNWCVFGAASECARLMAGMGGDAAYADLYLTDQLRWFDANGMYKDPHQPMVYDLVTRLQYMAALDWGYDGPSRPLIEEQLLKSAEATLSMQSVTGEMPYGGRSNQFLHNEAILAAVCEYYASWMQRRGEADMASRFKAEALLAVQSLQYWLGQKPVTHVKNRFPTESGYGCEGYAYFDKYMVTMASWAYLAYRFADDAIRPARTRNGRSILVTSPDFHQIVMNAGGYTVQFDTAAQPEYDSSGIGRFQRRGAPPVIALASPCPSVAHPNYKTDIAGDGPLAVSPEWEHYDIVEARKGRVVLTDGSSRWNVRLSCRGLSMRLKGEGEQTLALPALEFDGESRPEISCDRHELVIRFGGWQCRYVTDGVIEDSGKVYASRNGHLRRFDARGNGTLRVRASITRTDR